MYRNGHTGYDPRIDRVRQFELESRQRIGRAGRDKQQQQQGNRQNDHTVQEVFGEAACQNFRIIGKIQRIREIEYALREHLKLLLKGIKHHEYEWHK